MSERLFKVPGSVSENHFLLLQSWALLVMFIFYKLKKEIFYIFTKRTSLVMDIYIIYIDDIIVYDTSSPAYTTILAACTLYSPNFGQSGLCGP